MCAQSKQHATWGNDRCLLISDDRSGSKSEGEMGAMAPFHCVAAIAERLVAHAKIAAYLLQHATAAAAAAAT